MSKIADILYRRGDLPEALRIYREEVLPVFERRGEARSRALTMGRIANILHLLGDYDGALRIRREEELPVYERLDDVKGCAVTMGHIAQILHAKGDLDAALQMHRDRLQLADLEVRAHALCNIGQLLIESKGWEHGRGQEILDATSELFDLSLKLERTDFVGHIGSIYAQVLAMAGLRDKALAVLDQAEAAYAKLQKQSGLDHVRELCNRIRQMPARDDPPPADA